MFLAKPTVSTSDDTIRIEASIGDFALWFEAPAGSPLRPTGEALLSAALLPAMARGEGITLADDLPVDMAFLEHLQRLQELFLAWQQPWGLTLHPVTITAVTGVSGSDHTAGVASFLSGGVDGSYTAMRNRDRITTAVLLRGIDMQLENSALWEATHAGATRLATHFGLPMLAISSNIRFLGYHHGLKWARHYQGAGLATIGHLLGHARVLVAATSSLDELAPYGSHPLTDPLWSSSATSFEHEGAVPRTEKLRAIARDPVILSVLRVCWHKAGYNCGRCGKCLRTMVALHLLGAAAPTFPARIDWRAVVRIRLTGGIL